MLDFLIRKSAIKNAQKFIENLQPKVNIHLHKELPLPSVRLIKKLSVTVAEINALEEKISALRDDQLRAKTTEFKSKFPEAVKKEQEELDTLDKNYKEAASQEEKNDIIIQLEKVQEE